MNKPLNCLFLNFPFTMFRPQVTLGDRNHSQRSHADGATTAVAISLESSSVWATSYTVVPPLAFLSLECSSPSQHQVSQRLCVKSPLSAPGRAGPSRLSGAPLAHVSLQNGPKSAAAEFRFSFIIICPELRKENFCLAPLYCMEGSLPSDLLS